MWVIYKILQGIQLFQAVSASMADTFTQITSPLTPEKLEQIKYYLCLTSDLEQAIIKKNKAC